MEPENPESDGDDKVEKRTPLEKLADHSDKVLLWVAIAFAVCVVFMLTSLYFKFKSIGIT
jgi:hypothetical protein